MLPLWPAYSEAKARGEVSWIRRTLFLSIAATLAFVIAPMALGAAFARPIISFWVGGHAELPSKTLVWLLFLWNGAIFMQQPFGYMLAGISEVRRLTFYAAVSGVASTVLMYVLVHSEGVEGMVFGMFVGYLPYLILGNMTETGRVFRTSMRERRAAAPQVMEPQTVGSNT
jgi:O-antigen/teichoic acid export membrane protein